MPPTSSNLGHTKPNLNPVFFAIYIAFKKAHILEANPSGLLDTIKPKNFVTRIFILDLVM